MNLTRLMVLGTLARHGPQHGHQIRRVAEITNVGEWGGVSVGALYRELRSMQGEGLVAEIRTEKVGRRPARTVYDITDLGDLELAMLRERAITTVQGGPDPLGVALTFAGSGSDLDELATWLQGRRDILAITAHQIAADRDRLVAKGHIGPIEAAVMRRAELTSLAEVSWHDEFAKVLAAVPRDGAEDQARGQRPPGGPGGPDGPGGPGDAGGPPTAAPGK
jgi:DNA-binding PadR family transcriptional regulator